MHLKQENKYGCGLYAIVNALQQCDSLINEERLELSKEGNNIGLLNKWLIECGLDIWIWVVKYDYENKIDIFDLNPNFEKDKESLWLPFMIVIKSSENRNHAIGCRYMRDGSIIAHDSLLDEEIIFPNFNAFKEYYNNKVLSYECFCNFEGKVLTVIK